MGARPDGARALVWQEPLRKAFEEMLTVRAAAGVSARAVYMARQRDEEFALMWTVRLRALEMILAGGVRSGTVADVLRSPGARKLDQGDLQGMREDNLRRLAGLD